MAGRSRGSAAASGAEDFCDGLLGPRRRFADTDLDVLSDIIAPGRLRGGDPQALAALVAVGGWSVVAYCERAGAGGDVARATVLAFVAFRRRAIEAGDGAGADLERILLHSARDAVDEVRGEAPAPEEARAGEEAFARASPRPLSPRLATQALHALVGAAPVDGDAGEVRRLAEGSYAEAYAAAEAAPPVAGEQQLGAASPLLLAAVEARSTGSRPAPVGRPEPAPAGRQDADRPRRRSRGAGGIALATRLRALPPARRAAAFAVAIAALLLLVTVLSGGDDPARQATPTTPSAGRTVTVTATTTVPAVASARTPQVVRGSPRRPLTASGARFEVVPLTDAAWAQEVRAEQPRRGTRWLTVAVRTRNVRRRALVLRSLGYRLRTSRGVILGPRVLDVAEGPERAREGRLPIGSRASVHLGFELPFEETGGLSLAFEPGGLDEPTVLVPIGPQS